MVVNFIKKVTQYLIVDTHETNSYVKEELVKGLLHA